MRASTRQDLEQAASKPGRVTGFSYRECREILEEIDRLREGLRLIAADDVPGPPTDVFDWGTRLAQIHEYAESLLAASPESKPRPKAATGDDK